MPDERLREAELEMLPAVSIPTSPLCPVAKLLPDAIATLPPVKDALSPPIIFNEPPTLEEDLPAWNEISPEEPAEAEPVDI